VTLLRNLQGGETRNIFSFIQETLDAVKTARQDLFPAGEDTPPFVVIDEVQVAVGHLKPYFPSTIDPGPILSGTSLVVEMVKEATTDTGLPLILIVFTDSDIGLFTTRDSAQEDYIRQYLTLSDNIPDHHLLRRMRYWFSGQYVQSSDAIRFPLIFEIVTA